jgi:hypothetical protein
MKTFVTNLAAKSSPEDQLSAFKHWLFVRREALRYALAPLAVAIAFLARLALTPIWQMPHPIYCSCRRFWPLPAWAGWDRHC